MQPFASASGLEGVGNTAALNIASAESHGGGTGVILEPGRRTTLWQPRRMQRNQPRRLSAREVKALERFLSDRDRPEGTLSYHELQGFLFAVVCAPELIRPSEWLPLISNEADMGYADQNEAQKILGLIMTMYNEINSSVIERSDAMPSGCEFLPETHANLDEHAPISQWSRGFVEGHNWLGNLWSEYVLDEDTEMSEELGACLLTLSFFSSKPMAEALFCEGTDREREMDLQEFERFSETMRRLFPSALASYADIGRSISEALQSDG
jgi:uncharacterized protein